jgi:hypothetical protein
MFIASISILPSGSISIKPTPKFVTCIKSNSNSIPQNHKGPSSPIAPRSLAPHLRPLSLKIEAPPKEEERPLRAHFPVPSYFPTKEDEQYGFEMRRKLGLEPHLPLLQVQWAY